MVSNGLENVFPKVTMFYKLKGERPVAVQQVERSSSQVQERFVSMSKWRRELSCNVQPTWNDICVKHPVPFSTEPRAQLKIVGWLWDTRDLRCFYIFCSTSPLHQTCFQTVLFKHFHPPTHTPTQSRTCWVSCCVLICCCYWFVC